MIFSSTQYFSCSTLSALYVVMVLSQCASDKNSVPSTHLMKMFRSGRTSSAFSFVPTVHPVNVVDLISNVVGFDGTSIKRALREEESVGVEQEMKSTALMERDEEDDKEIFTIPPVPEALLIVSNCVPSAMLMSVISDASRSGTEFVEIEVN